MAAHRNKRKLPVVGWIMLTAVVTAVVAGGTVYFLTSKTSTQTLLFNPPIMSFMTNIISATQANTDFRQVLFTGARSQVVVMDIKPGEDIGKETHPHVEQTLFLLSGSGKAILDGVEKPFNAGDVLVVTPGTEHDVVNTGTESLKIYTIYAPPNHIAGRIHVTKADAEADTADEEFGNQVQ